VYEQFFSIILVYHEVYICIDRYPTCSVHKSLTQLKFTPERGHISPVSRSPKRSETEPSNQRPPLEYVSEMQ